MNIINIEHIHKIYGDKVIFDDVSCGIQEGDKIGIIGINGTGKTTLLKGNGRRTDCSSEWSSNCLYAPESGVSKGSNRVILCT